MSDDVKPQKEKRITNLMKKVFPFFNESDANNYQNMYTSEGDYSTSTFVSPDNAGITDTALGIAGQADRDRIFIKKLPEDRQARYKIYAEMSDDSTIIAAVELLLSYALSSNKKTGRAIYLRAKDEKDTELVDQLNRELIDPINKHIMSWSYTTAIYGVNYVRPYAEQGKGIVAWEANYYTLPTHIKEYERSGNLCGFTSENLKRKSDGKQIKLADPWILIPLKIPSWHPNIDKEPINYSGEDYSLYDDAYHRSPIETQNYGTSLIHAAFTSWCDLQQSIKSLLASRANSARIDRLVSVSTNSLDPQRASEYINSVSTQLKSDREAADRAATRSGILPTIWTSIIPVMGTGNVKGNVAIDTQQIDPNINAIEDITLHVKRLASSLGISPSLLGFEDLMAGGLGEGGWFRTSIQSALRANLIRGAVTNFIMRAIDIHTAYRDNKVWPNNDYPFEICFDSLNTAIQEEENANSESKANYITILATALDTIEQGMIGKSDTLKGYMYKDVLDLDPILADKIIKELASAAKEVSDENGMMESLDHQQIESVIRDVFYNEIDKLQL